ncbi:hypothetical protein ABFY57_00445 [Paenibacillus polymyxa]|uniref:hypothetical protein n=1 Tax=Paenibacillus polymyxa TaxID=1406 RepID=UPI003D2CC251
MATNTLLQMLNRKAVQAETKRLGIKITQEDLQQVLEQDSKGYDSEHAYFEEMQRQFGLDPVDLRNEAEYRIGLEKIATQGIQVEETEIDEYWEQHPEEFAVGKQIKLAALYVGQSRGSRGVAGSGLSKEKASTNAASGTFRLR